MGSTCRARSCRPGHRHHVESCWQPPGVGAVSWRIVLIRARGRAESGQAGAHRLVSGLAGPMCPIRRVEPSRANLSRAALSAWLASILDIYIYIWRWDFKCIVAEDGKQKSYGRKKIGRRGPAECPSVTNLTGMVRLPPQRRTKAAKLRLVLRLVMPGCVTFSKGNWNPTGIQLGSNWDPIATGIQLESNWDPTGIQLESNWDPTGIQLESNWDPTGIQLESNRDPTATGIQLESNWNPTGIQLGSN